MTAIGIDAGASHTTGILIDASGEELARAGAGGANLYLTEPAIVAHNLATVLTPLLAQGDPGAICVGAAGAGRQADVDQLIALLQPIVPAAARLIVVHDGRVALRAATPARPALVVIAGTGSLVYGERSDGTSSRAGGYGAAIGDVGSAYTIGRAALQHAARELDKAEERGPLAVLVQGSLDARSAADIIRRLDEGTSHVETISRLAMLVGQAHAQGDPVAQRIIEEQGRLLGALAIHVAESIRDGNSPLRVALSGGVFKAAPLLADVVTSALAPAVPSEILHSKIDGATGAAYLALEALQHA